VLYCPRNGPKRKRWLDGVLKLETSGASAILWNDDSLQPKRLGSGGKYNWAEFEALENSEEEITVSSFTVQIESITVRGDHQNEPESSNSREQHQSTFKTSVPLSVRANKKSKFRSPFTDPHDHTQTQIVPPSATTALRISGEPVAACSISPPQVPKAAWAAAAAATAPTTSRLKKFAPLKLQSLTQQTALPQRQGQQQGQPQHSKYQRPPPPLLTPTVAVVGASSSRLLHATPTTSKSAPQPSSANTAGLPPLPSPPSLPSPSQAGGLVLHDPHRPAPLVFLGSAGSQPAAAAVRRVLVPNFFFPPIRLETSEVSRIPTASSSVLATATAAAAAAATTKAAAAAAAETQVAAV